MMNNKITTNQKFKRYLCKYSFDTNKNLRKENLENVLERISNYTGSTICDTYKGFRYVIIWAKNDGITARIFLNDRTLSQTYRRYMQKGNMERLVKKYINYLIKNQNELINQYGKIN